MYSMCNVKLLNSIHVYIGTFYSGMYCATSSIYYATKYLYDMTYASDPWYCANIVLYYAIVL